MLIKKQYTVLEVLLSFWFITLCGRAAKHYDVAPWELLILRPRSMGCTYVLLNTVCIIFNHLHQKVKSK